jgi:SAM-dependent methyltransferase
MAETNRSQLNNQPLDPISGFDQALLDYWNGNLEATLRLYTSTGIVQTVPASYFFRQPEDFPPQEWMALHLCKGSVLDIGAGTGCHSLVLQDQGMEVWALDHSPIAVQIMRQRGILQVIAADIFSWDPQPFDTLLLLMNGIGLVQTLDGLDRFLQRAHRLVNPHGQILLDSTDLRVEENDTEAIESPCEVVFEVEYRGQRGLQIPWLFVDPDRLVNYASRAGWFCQVVFQGNEGSYLAKLIR